MAAMKKIPVSPRLDRFLSEFSSLSRSEAQRAVRNGRVTVDAVVVRDPSLHLGPGQAVAVDGAPVAARGPRYFMLHKPAGYVSVTTDSEHPTVLDLFAAGERHGLHVAGRLDRDATGLLLLTDDGAWSHRVTAPRRGCGKVYRAALAEPLPAAAAMRLRDGVLLDGEETPTAPAQVELLGPCEILLTIGEGRYHQVKRMLAAVGNRVVGLHRERVGGIGLDPALAPGEYRALTAEEVRSVG